MRLRAEKLGRRFNRQHIFKGIDLDLRSGDRLLVTGPNGSGKSTLLRVLAGQLHPSAGTVAWLKEGKELEASEWYRHLAWAAPYIDLYNDFSLEEALRLHFSFREPSVPRDAIPALLRLEGHLKKPLRSFSSGMLQRVKAALAILSQSEVLMLDEASANLDKENAEAIFGLMEAHLGDRILIFASNDEREFGRFERRLDLG